MAVVGFATGSWNLAVPPNALGSTWTVDNTTGTCSIYVRYPAGDWKLRIGEQHTFTLQPGESLRIWPCVDASVAVVQL